MLVLSSFHDWKSAVLSSTAPPLVHFVPTMGALHKGHGALIQAAKRAAGSQGHVVVSVYVNPTQFNDAADLSKYPRTQDADVQLAREHGADAVVFPTSEDMYPGGVPGRAPTSDYGALTQLWEAAHRPGHFDGVVAVVRKLFQQTVPAAAYFGEKDWQQLAVIRKLVSLEFPELQVVPVPTEREPDGLAMSSRNVRLSQEDRRGAAALHLALEAVARAGGDLAVLDGQRQKLEAAGHRLDYFAVVDADTLEPNHSKGHPGRVLIASHWGGVRLIDNVALHD